MTLELKKPTKNAFQYFLRLSLDDYANSLYRYDEAADLTRAMQIANDEVLPLVPKGLESKNQYIYRVKDKGKNVGWLWHQIVDEGKTGFLLYIYVFPEHRSKGYGAKLLALFENKAKEQGAEKIILFVFQGNTHAVDLYKKHGYDIEKEAGFYDATKATRYKMTKKA